MLAMKGCEQPREDTGVVQYQEDLLIQCEELMLSQHLRVSTVWEALASYIDGTNVLSHDAMG